MDPSFGTNGIVKTKLGFYNLAAFHFVLQPGQKILAAGFYKLSEALEKTKMVVRFNANGGVDSGFGTGGVVGLFNEDIDAIAARIALASNGMIYVGTVNRFLAPPEPFLFFGNWPQPDSILQFADQINQSP